MDALGVVLGPASIALLAVLLMSVVRTLSAARRADRVLRAAEYRTTGATAVAILAVVGLVVAVPRPAGFDWTNPLVSAATVPVLGAVMTATATLVELTWPRPRGTVRVAVARPRPDVNPTLRTLRTWSAGTLVAVCVLTAVVGALDAVDQGTRMPKITAFPVLYGGLFPGWPYGLAVLAGLGLLTLVSTWALRVVESRPALDAEHADLDAVARLTSTGRILRIAACCSWLAVLGVAFVAGSSLHEFAQSLRMVESPAAHYPPFDWRQDLAFALFALGSVAGVLALVAAVTDAAPRRPVPAEAGASQIPTPRDADRAAPTTR